MRPPAVVERQISADGGSRLGHAVVGFEIHLLVFDAAPQPLDKHIVAPGSLAIHADRNLVLQQDLREGRRCKLGGFKRSSQHPEVGGCDEQSKAAVGSVGTSAVTVTGSAACGGTR